MYLKKCVHCTTLDNRTPVIFLYWWANTAIVASHLHGWQPSKAAVVQYFMIFKNKVLKTKQPKKRNNKKKYPAALSAQNFLCVQCSFPEQCSLALQSPELCSWFWKIVLHTWHESSPLNIFARQSWNFSNSIKPEPGSSPPRLSSCLCASNYHF